MSDFAEIYLDLGYDYGASGGPEFRTGIVVTASGIEARNQQWEVARRRWDIGERSVVKTKKDYLLDFFHARRGAKQGFRFRDWGDYQVEAETFTPAGAKTHQLVKTYDDGSSNAYTRNIVKPRAATVALQRAGAPYSYDSVDETSGILTLTYETLVFLDSITATNPCTVTTGTPHGFSTGKIVWLSGMTGNFSSLADAAYTITVIDTDTFSLDGIDATGETGGPVSGTAETYLQGEDLTWSGEYDCPARFGSDQMRFEFLGSEGAGGEHLYYLQSLPILELKS
jgi:uncharacterized protein (TIGR02217 family)